MLITPDGSARLVDFGLARTAASRLTTEGTIAGTVFYFAPEQALGQTIDSRVDLYALGVVRYELTAERLPFAGDDLLTVISQHVHAPVVPPSSYNAAIPPALDALIVQLLSKRPEDRPASAAKVRQSLDDLSPPEADVGLDHVDYGWAVALYDESLTPARELSDKEVIARLLLPPGETMPQIEVLLVDDHALFREGLAGLLSSQPDMKVVGEAGDGLEALVMAQELQPDLILMDVTMPGCDGLEATQLIKLALPEVKIVMLTAHDEDDRLFEAIRSGAVGYLLKSTTSEALLPMLRAVMRGEAAVSGAMAARILEEFGRLTRLPLPFPREDLPPLTVHEREVLRSVADGEMDGEIAAKLRVSLSAVKAHVRNVLAKLHAASRQWAAAYTVQEGTDPSTRPGGCAAGEVRLALPGTALGQGETL